MDLAALAPDVRIFFPGANFFLLPEDDAMQDEHIGELRVHILRAFTNPTRALEIGPSLNPVLPKADGYNVAVLDHTDQAGIVAEYAAYGLDTGVIEPVDFVWNGGSLAETVLQARFDAIVACHVVEHAPDLLAFLADCSAILGTGGTIYLIVPDKRYRSDIFQPLTDVAKVLGERRARRAIHPFESYYRNGAHVYDAERLAWDQRGITNPRFPYNDPKLVRGHAERSSEAQNYEDVHENYFTPVLFMMMVDELRYLI